MNISRCVGMVGVWAAVGILRASAATISWTNEAGGSFADGGNWQDGVAPGASDVARFDLNATYTVTAGVATTHAEARFNAAGGKVSVDLGSGADWYPTNILYVGDAAAGAAEVEISGGAFSTRSLQLGASLASGALTLVNATGTVAGSAQLTVGQAGTGRLTLATPDSVLLTATSGNHTVASGAGSVGALVVSNGLLSVTGNLYVGNSGQGELWIGRGTGVIAGTLGIGINAGSSGRVILAEPGAELRGSPRVGVSAGAQGVVLLSNGVWNTAGEVKLGEEGESLLVLAGGSMICNTSGAVNSTIYLPFGNGTSRIVMASAESTLTQIGPNASVRMPGLGSGYGELILSNGTMNGIECSLGYIAGTVANMYQYNATSVFNKVSALALSISRERNTTGTLVLADSRALMLVTNGTGIGVGGFASNTGSNSYGRLIVSNGTIITRGLRVALADYSRGDLMLEQGTIINLTNSTGSTSITLGDGRYAVGRMVMTDASSLVAATNTPVGTAFTVGNGVGSSGYLIMSNGTALLNRLVVASDTGSYGFVSLENQAAISVKDNLYIPNNATRLGLSTGVLVLASADATLSATSGNIVVGASWGGAKAGSGTLIVSNGTVQIKLLNIGSASDGLVTVLDGTLEQGSTAFGDGVKLGTSTEGGTGTLVLAHANALLNTPANNLVFGNQANSSGRMILSNGTAVVRSLQLGGSSQTQTNTFSEVVIEDAALEVLFTEFHLSSGANSRSRLWMTHPNALVVATNCEVRMSATTNTWSSIVMSNGTLVARTVILGSGQYSGLNPLPSQYAEWIIHNATGRLLAPVSATIASLAVGNRAGTTGLMVMAHAGAMVESTNVSGSSFVLSHIADFGEGRLIVSNGLLKCGTLSVGNSTGSLGHARVEGGMIDALGDLRVGRFGTGTLSIAGGQVSARTLSMVFTNTSTNASATLELSGGTLSVSNIVAAAAEGARSNLWLSGGTLAARGNFTNLLAMTLTNSPGPGLFTFSTAFTNIQSGPLTGPGGLAKAGAGLLRLTQVNDYTGETVVNEGTLALIGAASVANSTQLTVAAGAVLDVSGPGSLTVASGQVLKGDGTVQGDVVNEGRLAPGSSPGTLTVAGAFSQTGTLALELSGTTPGTEHDVLAVTGNAALGGTLEVTTPSFTPSAGNSFTVLTAAAVSGSFATTNLPALSGGNTWVVDVQADQVVLSVESGGGPEPTPYETWADGFGLTGTNRYDAVDTDGDGHPNLLEYALGSNPTSASSGVKLRMTLTNGAARLLIQRVNSATDIVYHVEGAYQAVNGAAWSGLASNVLGVWSGGATVDDNNTGAVHEVRVVDPVGGATNRFLRLRVERP